MVLSTLASVSLQLSRTRSRKAASRHSRASWQHLWAAGCTIPQRAARKRGKIIGQGERSIPGAGISSIPRALVVPARLTIPVFPAGMRPREAGEGEIRRLEILPPSLELWKWSQAGARSILPHPESIPRAAGSGRAEPIIDKIKIKPGESPEGRL